MKIFKKTKRSCSSCTFNEFGGERGLSAELFLYMLAHISNLSH